MSKNNILISVLLLLMLTSGIFLWMGFKDLNDQRKELNNEKDDLDQVRKDLKSKLIETDSLLNIQKTITDKIVKEIPQGNPADSLHKLIFKYKKNAESVNKIVDDPEKLALQFEKDGFNALINNQFTIALDKFMKAEKASPSFHMAYEISRLLKSEKANLENPAIQRKIKKQIIDKYSWRAPVDLLKKLRAQIKE